MNSACENKWKMWNEIFLFKRTYCDWLKKFPNVNFSKNYILYLSPVHLKLTKFDFLENEIERCEKKISFSHLTIVFRKHPV